MSMVDGGGGDGWGGTLEPPKAQRGQRWWCPQPKTPKTTKLLIAHRASLPPPIYKNKPHPHPLHARAPPPSCSRSLSSCLPQPNASIFFAIRSISTYPSNSIALSIASATLHPFPTPKPSTTTPKPTMPPKKTEGAAAAPKKASHPSYQVRPRFTGLFA